MNKRILLPICRPVYSTAQDKECLFLSCSVQEDLRRGLRYTRGAKTFIRVSNKEGF